MGSRCKRKWLTLRRETAQCTQESVWLAREDSCCVGASRQKIQERPATTATKPTNAKMTKPQPKLSGMLEGLSK